MIPSYLTGERYTLEAISRAHCQTVYLGSGMLLCRVLGRYMVYVDPEDICITPHLSLNGFWESWITIAMARVVKPGWYCVDVGANQGYYTLIMADAVESDGRTLAIEPNPQLTTMLSFSLDVNGFNRHTTVVQKAASNTDSQRVNLVVPQHRAMNATVCRDATASDEVVEVETVTIDGITNNWPRVDLIKIDAEGAEYAIWHGMRKTLEDNPEITILMEIGCSRYPNPQAFLEEIQESGFPLRYIDYDAQIQNITEKELLTHRTDEDWMLFLQRDISPDLRI